MAGGKKKKGKGGGSKPRPVGLADLKIQDANHAAGVPSKDKYGTKWQPGDSHSYPAAGDGDGAPIDDWLNHQLSPGQTQQQWLSGAVDNMRAAGKDVPDMSNSSDVKGWLDGIYARNPDGAGSEIFSDWKAAGAKYDPSWQYQTSLKEYTGNKESERVYDKSKKSWVVTDAPIVKNLNGDEVGYLVRNDAKKGSIFEASYTDKDGVTHTTNLIVGDHGPSFANSQAEMSQKGISDLHLPGGTVNSVGGNVKLTYLGQGDLSHLPTQASVDADAARLKEELAKKKAEKKSKSKGKKKQASLSQEQGGAYYMAVAPDHGVCAGENQKLVTVAHPECQHSGMKAVVTGSSTEIRVGVAQSLLSGEGDELEDGTVIKERTGDQTVVFT